MDIGAVIALVSIAGSMAILGLLVAGAWALGRAHERRAMQAAAIANGLQAEKIARMERMLETISTDVERLLEEKRQPILPGM